MHLRPVDQLVADDVWAEGHARFLHLVFVEFDLTGEWPLLEDLVRKVARAGEQIDIYAELQSLPPSLGFLESERLTLMIRGLKPVRAADPLVTRFLGSLRLAREIYLSDKPPVLRSSYLADRLGIGGSDVEKLVWFLDREGYWSRGGSGDPGAGNWERTIAGNIQRLGNVTTIDDYLKEIDRIRGVRVDEPDVDAKLPAAGPSMSGQDAGKPGSDRVIVSDTFARGGPTPTEARDTGGADEAAVVFLVHGRDKGAREEVARFLEKAGRHRLLILDEQASRGRTLIEKFEAHAQAAKYAVVLLTGDDVGRANDDLDDRPRARQNVVFELGFFFGTLGRENVAVLYETAVEKPSDVDGLVYIALKDNWRERLVRELRGAELDFSLDRLS